MMALKIAVLAAIFTACNAQRLPNATVAPVTVSAASIARPAPPRSTTSISPPVVCADAVSTTTPLGRLRGAIKNASLDAFIIFHTDEHLSDEPSFEDRRLEYISGWNGPGTGAVLGDGGAALFVPTGSTRRARETVSCAWIVLDADDLSQPNISDWIMDSLMRYGHVGADARLASIDSWERLEGLKSIRLVHSPMLLDQMWAEDPNPNLRRPDYPRIVANVHPSELTDVTWREKVAKVRRELEALNVTSMVVTALDEIAWLLNIRGRDLPYAPLLKAFVVITRTDVRVYAPQGKLPMPVREALATYNCFTNCTRIKDYSMVYSDLRRHNEYILIPTAATFQKGASAAILQSVPRLKQFLQTSPIIYLKAQKDEAEAKGMRKAQLRDAVAISTVLSYLEKMFRSGLNEQTMALKVDETRATQENFVGISMRTRVAFGPSAIEPEYMATNISNRKIYKNSTVVIQSGGQYVEGTTLVTRTVHYGNPTAEERRAYTTVLRSLAALATLQTPSRIPAAHIDPVARSPLWAANQDDPLPTGHGIGAALNRREDPVVLDYRQDINLYNLRERYFITAEPAWYEGQKFGVKLGNVLEVASTSNNLVGMGYLFFKESTLVPFEPKLIDKNMLTEYEKKWLNTYNDRIRTVIGPELKAQGLMDVYHWLMNKTEPIKPPKPVKLTKGTVSMYNSLQVLLCVAIGLVINMS